MKIQQRLQTLFENQRLIFWYDDDNALKEEFESINIEGVEKLIIDNNEFSIKRQILRLQPESKFLIYSPTNAPTDEENWLLDLNIANYMFAADKTSLILQNIGLDVSFKTFISQFDTFFNASSRTEALKARVSDNETNASLSLKMMAVSIGSDDNIESIMLRVFGDEKHFETLRKFGLEQEFFKAVEHKFAYAGDSVKDLLHKLLLNHFYYHLDKSKCTLGTEARLFIKSWMDSSRYAESFEKISKEVSDELNINTILSELDASKVISCDTYEKCDQVVITHLLSRLNDESINAEEMANIIHTREHTFWYGYYKNIYRAILSASLLFDFVKQSNLSMQSFDEGIKEYSSHWYNARKDYAPCIRPWR